jgi:hypothetical protein
MLSPGPGRAALLDGSARDAGAVDEGLTGLRPDPDHHGGEMAVANSYRRRERAVNAS